MQTKKGGLDQTASSLTANNAGTTSGWEEHQSGDLTTTGPADMTDVFNHLCLHFYRPSGFVVINICVLL